MHCSQKLVIKGLLGAAITFSALLSRSGAGCCLQPEVPQSQELQICLAERIPERDKFGAVQEPLQKGIHLMVSRETRGIPNGGWLGLGFFFSPPLRCQIALLQTYREEMPAFSKSGSGCCAEGREETLPFATECGM